MDTNARLNLPVSSTESYVKEMMGEAYDPSLLNVQFDYDAFLAQQPSSETRDEFTIVFSRPSDRLGNTVEQPIDLDDDVDAAAHSQVTGKRPRVDDSGDAYSFKRLRKSDAQAPAQAPRRGERVAAPRVPTSMAPARSARMGVAPPRVQGGELGNSGTGMHPDAVARPQMAPSSHAGAPGQFHDAGNEKDGQLPVGTAHFQMSPTGNFGAPVMHHGAGNAAQGAGIPAMPNGFGAQVAPDQERLEAQRVREEYRTTMQLHAMGYQL